MSTMTVDSVCTEAQLDEYLGGSLQAQIALCPAGWTTAGPARQFALDEALDHLRRRKPPIRETDITDVTELRRAVLYGASARLYDLAMTSGSDAELWNAKWKTARKLFEGEIAGVEITGPSGVSLIGGSIRISRG